MCYKGQVNNAGELRRAIVPLLAAAVLVQGVLGLVPHQHHPEALPGATPTSAPCSSPDRPRIAPAVDESHPATFCLACVITPSAFAQPDEAPSLVCLTSCPAAAPVAREAACLPRHWRSFQRGPPPAA